MTATSASPTTATSAITTTISPSVVAAAVALTLPLVTGAIGIILRWIEMRRKVLRRRGVGIWLALLRRFEVLLFSGCGRLGIVDFLQVGTFFSGVNFFADRWLAG